MIRRRELKPGAAAAGGPVPPADLLVCFPSRAHLTLLPKPTSSPARSSLSHRRRPHPLKRSHTRSGSFGGGGGGHTSPFLWAKSKQMGGVPEIAEPTSPKVTCAGQIKVRPRSSACRNWQSVMEEIERIHTRSKRKKRSFWSQSTGFKKDIMNFLTCLRSIRFDFRCFGAYPEPEIISDEEEDEEEDQFQYPHDEIDEEDSESNDNSKAMFSKWFMVLQENQSNGIINGNEIRRNEERNHETGSSYQFDEEEPPAVPPPNALLLMRCRSAPAKTWLQKSQKGEEEEEEKVEEVQRENAKELAEPLPVVVEEEKKKKKRESLAIVMRYDTDFYKLSTDIAKETWVVGGFNHPFSKSRSCKR